MSLSSSDIARLIWLSITGNITDDERRMLEQWASLSAANQQTLSHFSDPEKILQEIRRRIQLQAEKAFIQLQERLPDIFDADKRIWRADLKNTRLFRPLSKAAFRRKGRRC